jgi:Ribbon-helix-helix protein, copG family
VTRTTITLDDDVDAKLKEAVKKSGKSFKETVNETLRAGLLAQGRQQNRKPFKIRTFNMGLKPGYSYDKPWDLIEEIEGPGYK